MEDARLLGQELVVAVTNAFELLLRCGGVRSNAQGRCASGIGIVLHKKGKRGDSEQFHCEMLTVPSFPSVLSEAPAAAVPHQ